MTGVISQGYDLPRARVYFLSWKIKKSNNQHPLGIYSFLKQIWGISRELQEYQAGQLSGFSLCKLKDELRVWAAHLVLGRAPCP